MNFKIRTCHMVLIMIPSILVSMVPSGCDPRFGMLESAFRLSNNSRLPKWVAGIDQYSRDQLSMTIEVYTFNRDKIYLYGPHHKLLKKYIGTNRWHPVSERSIKEHRGYGFPNYTVITVGGIAEIFEQKRPGDILYITDDARLRQMIEGRVEEGPGSGLDIGHSVKSKNREDHE